MTADEIIEQLKPLGRDSYKSVMFKHGVPEPIFGVKIEDLKVFQKKIKKNYQLALDLYDSGIYDARYLAGLIADDRAMSRTDLQHWADTSSCLATSEYTVAWVASESLHGHALALKWIDSNKEKIATTGWATLSGLVSITDDSKLDLEEIKQLLQRVQETIHEQPNRVRYVMNGFVIAVGCYVAPLTALAEQVGKAIGSVTVEMGDTSCKVPSAPAYIDKVRQRGTLGKKRKTIKC
jgi:3-methyladenine DNA glycosylase AlkD